MFDNNFEPQLGSYDMRIDTSEMPSGLARKLNSHICMKGGSSGGGSTVTKTSSIPDEWKPYISKSLAKTETASDSGALSKVAGLSASGLQGLDVSADRSAQSRNGKLGGAGAGILDRSAAKAEASLGQLGDASQGKGLFGAADLSSQASELKRKAQGARGANDAAFGAAGSQGSARQARAQGQTDATLAGQLGALDYQDLQARRQGSIQGSQGVLSGAGQVQKAGLASSKELQKSGTVYQNQQQKHDDAEYQGLSRLFGLYGSAPFQSQQNSVQPKQGGK